MSKFTNCVYFHQLWFSHFLTYNIQIVWNMYFLYPNWNRGESGNDLSEESELKSHQKKTQQEIMQQCNFTQDHLIDPRLVSEVSLFGNKRSIQTLSQSHMESCNSTNQIQDKDRCKSYSSMIVLITGSLVGEAELSKVYADQLESNTTSDSCVPSIAEVATKVARVEKNYWMRNNTSHMASSVAHFCYSWFVMEEITTPHWHNTLVKPWYHLLLKPISTMLLKNYQLGVEWNNWSCFLQILLEQGNQQQ